MTEHGNRHIGPQREYRAVCFDLDGTLLPMDIQEFLGSYFKSLTEFIAQRGADPQLLKKALNAGTHAMTLNQGPQTNEQVYWSTFMDVMERHAPEQERRTLEQWQELFTEFYETRFDAVGRNSEPSLAMVRAVKTLAEKNYPLLLTTMPLFPPVAVKLRLGWAGIDADLFSRLTQYENSTAAKPSLRYYAENLAAMDVDGADVLMVGNNTVEDLAFCKLGADAYLVTDYLLDPVGLDLATVKHGSAQEFADWVDALPVCAHPVEYVCTGPVDSQLTDQVLDSCGCLSPEELKAAEEEAAAAARFNQKVAGELAPTPVR